jgi:hypothetical protein
LQQIGHDSEILSTKAVAQVELNEIGPSCGKPILKHSQSGKADQGMEKGEHQVVVNQPPTIDLSSLWDFETGFSHIIFLISSHPWAEIEVDMLKPGMPAFTT